MVLGHEAAGYVDDLGPGVAGLRIGDPVLVTLIRSCGDCPACEDAAPTSCDHAYTARQSPISGPDGPITQSMATGAFAERVTVDHSQCVRVPGDIDLSVACLLSCGVITGFGAVTNTAGLKPGQSCAVIGTGGVGLNTIQGAALSGASRIVAIDRNAEKLDLARRFGATETLCASSTDLAEKIRAGRGRGVDYVFVTVGAPAVFESAPDLLAPGGAMVMVGLPSTETRVSYSPTAIAAMNQRLLGSRMGQTVLSRDVPALIELYRQGQLQLDALVTGRYALDDINTAIDHARSGRALRNVIVF